MQRTILNNLTSGISIMPSMISQGDTFGLHNRMNFSFAQNLNYRVGRPG